MSRWDAAKSAERGSTPDRIRATTFPPQSRPDPVRRHEPVAPTATAQRRPAPRSESAWESLRVTTADLGPLARPRDALIADLSRIEIALSRLGAAKTGDAQSFGMGAEAVREVVRRMRLVVTAGDALVAGGQ